MPSFIHIVMYDLVHTFDCCIIFIHLLSWCFQLFCSCEQYCWVTLVHAVYCYLIVVMEESLFGIISWSETAWSYSL